MAINRLAVQILVVSIVGLLVSCAIRPDVTGRWQRVDREDTLEFREDGTFTAVDDSGAAVEGRYTFHADGTLYYTVTHTSVLQAQLEPVETLEVHIAGLKFQPSRNELEIATEGGGEVEVYRQVDRVDPRKLTPEWE